MRWETGSVMPMTPSICDVICAAIAPSTPFFIIAAVIDGGM